MKHISYRPSNLKLSKAWKARVKRLKAQLADATTAEERKALVSKYPSTWSVLKPQLAELSHHTCWYSEAPQIGTDTDIDHFRPKGRVHGIDHPGYWWLTYDPQNYRYCCIVTNRRRTDPETNVTGGKSDHFSLCDESKRAKTPNSKWRDEQPLLLDPTKAGDVVLLDFKEDGQALPRYSKEDRPRAHDRASYSIDKYHLNHSDFIRERKKIRDKLQDQIESAQRYFDKLDEGDAVIEEAYSKALESILKLQEKSSPFSRYAASLINASRGLSCLAGL